jgi:transglutaminase-like putative cysteine protease
MHLETVRRQYLGTLPPAEAGTRATLRVMRDLVRRYKRAGRIRETALELTAGLRPKDWPAEVRALFEFVRDRIRYVRDVHGVETIQTPDVTLDLEQGDCDDKSTLLAALLESIGHPTRFVAVGFSAPDSYSHVYVETRVGPRWIALDPTVPYAAGWAPPRAASRLIVHN